MNAMLRARIQLGRRPYRRGPLAVIWAITLSLLVFTAMPALAAEEAKEVDALPVINNFSSARFDMLMTLRFGEVSSTSYGSGSLVMPDRVSLWLATNESNELSYYVQIGTVIYTNDGSGWKRGDDLPPGAKQNITFIEQLDLLQEHATAIMNMGTAHVRGTPTTHYQLWLSGDRVLELDDSSAGLDDETYEILRRSTFKLDLWVGQQDGLLYQQNVVFTMPAIEMEDEEFPETELSSLTTFYDLNDPTITIEAPGE